MLSFKEFLLEKPVIDTNRESLKKRLRSDGWVSGGGTNHEKFKHPTNSRVIVLPYHRNISIGVARDAHKAAGYI
jgi:predicted RNA binding protein YcfA (HicA-like mRNA interferase family)